MDLTDIIGVCGFFLAAGSLVWQYYTEQVRLRVGVDETKSDFVIGNLVSGGPERDKEEFNPCTVLCLAISVANTSNRPNTVVRIEVVEPAARDLRSPGLRVYFDKSPAAKSDPRELSEWEQQQFFQPGGWYEAWSYCVVEKGVWRSDTPKTIKVCAVDAHGRKHCCRARLRHRPPEQP